MTVQRSEAYIAVNAQQGEGVGGGRYIWPRFREMASSEDDNSNSDSDTPGGPGGTGYGKEPPAGI